MKKVVLFAVSLLVLSSCGTTKSTMAPAVESDIKKTTSLEGQQVMSETV